MNRRQFLKVAAVIPAASASRAALAQALFAPRQEPSWRTFEITTRVEVKDAPAGMTRAWLPIPSVNSEYQKPLGDEWSGNATATILSDQRYGASMLYAQWPASEKEPMVELRSRIQ